jgi:sugar lactone lactonase YvrE
MKTKMTKTWKYSLGGAACVGALLFASSAPAQNLFVETYNTGNIYEFTPGGSQSTFATGMLKPGWLAFNANGDLFVANTANNAPGGNITKITRGGVPSTFASGVDPSALVFNNAGNLIVADYNSGNIYQYTPGGVQSTFTSGFTTPTALAMDSLGDLFVASGFGTGSGIITKITPGNTQTVFATGLSFTRGMTFTGAGDLLVADNSNNIHEFTPGGSESTFATVNSPDRLAFDSSGNLFVSTFGGPVIEIAPDGTQSTFGNVGDIGTGLAFQPVPEPTTFALLGIGVTTFFARRRR